jgi:hypothetical protein
MNYLLYKTDQLQDWCFGFFDGDILYSLTQTLASSKFYTLMGNQGQVGTVTEHFPA